MAEKDDDYYSTDGDLVTDSEDEIQGYEDFDGTDVELAELLPFWSGTHRKFKWCKRCPGHIESSKMAVWVFQTASLPLSPELRTSVLNFTF